ncbi:MAG TPA: copper-binding protein [Burkholderiales bacterium]|nr:copper-binding protein [Burkholderiales bacterium]
MKRFVFFFMLVPLTALAQYAGQEHRDLKALSPEEVKQYLAGAGMGYAKPAELNHFPGPMHALELADRLGLSEEQKAKTRALMDAHKAEARAIGAKLVQSERALEALFRSGKVAPEALEDAVRATAKLQGEYRLSHLETHRRMRALLTDEQVKHYDALRGYGAGPVHHSVPGHKHGHAGSEELADGEVRRVDKGAQKVTIQHGPMPQLDMPHGMTMVYRVKDPKLLDQVKAGDKVRFGAEKVDGAYTVTRIQPAK